jgi:oxaloacetate decarboxylase (Na+ extruding) subunit alpha
LIAPELEKTREAVKDLMIQEEDVLTYALLPQVAEKFFQMRKNGTLDAVKEEPKKQAAPAVASPQPTTVASDSDDEEDEIAAVMSAAIASIESEHGGGQFAITNIRQISPWVISARLNR